VDDVLLSWGTGGGAFAQCLSITIALLRGPTSGATEGAGPLELALLLGGVVFLLLLLSGFFVCNVYNTASRGRMWPGARRLVVCCPFVPSRRASCFSYFHAPPV
jgi:hypothetical protein